MPGFPSQTLIEWLGIAKKANDEKLGFSINQRLKTYYRDGEDAYLMAINFSD